MQRLRTAPLVLALVAGLSGCLAVGPDHEVPETVAPEAWHTDLERGVEAGEADLATWWTALEDPVLDELVARAHLQNLDLRQALSRIEEAAAARGIAAGELVPSVDGVAEWARTQRSDNIVFPFGPRTQENAYVGLAASWEVDLWGRIRRTVEAADADLGATVEDARDVRVSLAATVALTYVELRTLQRRLEIAESNLGAQLETLRITESRLRAGIAAELDVAQARSNSERTRASIPGLRANLTGVTNQLTALLALPPGELDELLAEPTGVPAPPERVAIGVPADLLRRRPDVRRAERELAAQTARVGVATAELYPRLSLFGSIGLEAQDTSDLTNSGSDVFRLRPSLTLPIFNGGALRANIAVQDARQEQALLAYEATVLDAYAEADSALAAFSREHERREALAGAVEAASTAVTKSESLYREGLVDFQNVLDSQRSLFSVEDELAQSEAAITANLVQLYRAVGGGWDPGTAQ